MLRIKGGGDEHEKFKELGALAASGNLTPLELCELQSHLEGCEQCLDAFLQYRSLATHGLTVLVDGYTERLEQANWDSTPARERLMMRIRAHQQSALERNSRASISAPPPALRRPARGSLALALMGLAACLVLTMVWGAYRLGARTHERTTADIAPVSVDDKVQGLAHEKNAADELRAAQSKRLAQLQQENSAKEQELMKLRSALRGLKDRSSELASASNRSEAQLRDLLEQRDDLSSKFQVLNQTYRDEQAQLVKLRSERDNTALRVSSLEAKIDELTTRNREQERRLNDTELYLSSDRDIRELMGARKLYIADVFDVDGSSRTQKPFGRVFYTQGRSLIFYAFDLDHEPGAVNASTFQVWGQRETPQGERALPMNLGILYMDNESNRRWVMRFDDPKKLAEIDAVFVTVEPRGGSHKPTSKPFLYALLRNEANHP